MDDIEGLLAMLAVVAFFVGIGFGIGYSTGTHQKTLIEMGCGYYDQDSGRFTKRTGCTCTGIYKGGPR